MTTELILSTTETPAVPVRGGKEPVLFHAYFHLPIELTALDPETRTITLLGQQFPVKFKDGRARKIWGIEGTINVTFYLRQGPGRMPKKLKIARGCPYNPEKHQPDFSIAGQVVRADSAEGISRIVVYPQNPKVEPFFLDFHTPPEITRVLQEASWAHVTGQYVDHQMVATHCEVITMQKPEPWKEWSYRKILQQKRKAKAAAKQATRQEQQDQ